MICIWRLGQGASSAAVAELAIATPMQASKAPKQRLVIISAPSISCFQKAMAEGRREQ
jgi:hypothetical protein